MLKKWIPNNTARNIVEWAIVLVAAAILAFVVNTFLAQTANVTGDSMVPTLAHDDVVVVNKLAYRFGKPKYNDIVVFPYEGNPWDDGDQKYYIKRVIGLPGDEMDWQNGAFLRNGEKLNDAFSEAETMAGTVKFPLTVPEGTCFVLGDNRNVSDDSRYTAVGCMPFGKLVGKVSLRVLPFSKIGGVK